MQFVSLEEGKEREEHTIQSRFYYHILFQSPELGAELGFPYEVEFLHTWFVHMPQQKFLALKYYEMILSNFKPIFR